jgi:hypothetical protein
MKALIESSQASMKILIESSETKVLAKVDGLERKVKGLETAQDALAMRLTKVEAVIENSQKQELLRDQCRQLDMDKLQFKFESDVNNEMVIQPENPPPYHEIF